ncbi:hypothetical protein UFOVP128_14 [uncultured Caudovirales phage]|uniref:Uncharacterized protein n=1 Tax=uncultured Caudovirales phage TaxID=2100421 RepID=A0A6J5L7K5_9CAUD|nr:hypothetical protein UFOVP128_14 [uncultured Caudovirales phage]CAB5222061.1 hypothetical protein UFOVP243_30 [uncultured Caudovirales phage]
MNLSDIGLFLDLVSNPKQYQAKLKELKEYDDSLKANIALSHDVADIETAKSLAAKALTEATGYIDQAKEQAENIISAARTAYETRFAALAQKEKEADEAVATKNRIEAAHAARENAVAQLEKQLVKRSEQLRQDELSVQARLAEVSERLEKLKSVMG